MIHFDAHVDTWPDNFGQPYAHGSMFYHAINEGVVDARRMIQIGIRSPVQREVYDWTLGQGVTIVAAQEAHEIGPAAIASRIVEVVGDAPVYLTFDVDALDPAFAPGTGTPEIGGLATWQAQSIIRKLAGLNFVGMDVVEVAPAYDVSEITALAGATMAWEYLSLLAASADTSRSACAISLAPSPASMRLLPRAGLRQHSAPNSRDAAGRFEADRGVQGEGRAACPVRSGGRERWSAFSRTAMCSRALSRNC